jgi:ribosomal protein S18 acetylase RimI-like enzyme
MIIRKARIEDAAFIAKYLLLAMEDIVYKFIGEVNAQKANNLLLFFAAREANQYSWENCWVVEEDGVVVAAVDVYDGGRLHDLRQPVVDHIRKYYNADWQPEDETQAGEFYIDSLGVDPSQRGRGIGSMLLQFLMHEYVTKHGYTLGLLVDEDNQPAKRLYVRLGFRRVGVKEVFGKRLEHLQQ